ncbi:MAG: tandem-95 repeat protein [Thermoflexales bacterium]|nr:tandem-95 repeat protein [Thermoflexales bacterium]
MSTKRLAQTASVFLLGALLLALARAASLPRAAQATANAWGSTGSMTSARREHSATLLPDGRLLVVGGIDTNNTDLKSAQVYDPASGAWSSVEDMTYSRSGHSTTLLPNGRVLITGGKGTGGLVLHAELYDPATGQWSLVLMRSGRFHHTATLLADGRVLLAGGEIDQSHTPSDKAELYDPATGVFTSTGRLGIGRYGHSATLLPDGRVLVAGGYRGSSSYETSGELYDPATGEWSPAGGSMSSSRAGHSATLLPDGRVLVAGGENAGGPLSGADLYTPGAYPAQGSWSSTGALGAARRQHTAARLPDGRVLVAGGYGGGGALASAELYDPAAGTWSDTAAMNAARYNHTATLLPGGRVLVAGGSGSGTLASAELYDSAAGAFAPTAALDAARDNHTATLLPDGRVLVVGGYDASGYLTSTELYDPATGAFTPTAALNTARRRHTATLLPDGRVLVAGGWSSSGAITSTELYDPVRDIWSPASPLNIARCWHTATLLPDGRVLVVGGQSNSNYEASGELYDPATGTWSLTGGLMSSYRGKHTATLLPDGRVLLAGGYDGGGHLASAELYDPATGVFTRIGSLNTARHAHTATLLPDGRVLLVGGHGYSGALASAELYDPATAAFILTGSLNAARYGHTATLLPDGRVLVAGGWSGSASLPSADLYDPAAGTFTPTASLNAARYYYTAMLLPDGRILVAGGNDGSDYLASAELYTQQLDWRPALDSVTTPLALGNRLSARGSGWRGYNYAEASGGGTANSATNYPLVQLRRLDNEQVKWLLPDPARPFSATEFTSRPIADLTFGHALATVFVNGIPSVSKIIQVRADCAPIAWADPELALFSDGFENGYENWTMDGLWHVEAETDPCGSQRTPFPSPTHAAYHGRTDTCQYDDWPVTAGMLTLSRPVSIQGKSWAFSFWSYEQIGWYSVGGWDKLYVELSTASGLNAARYRHSAVPLIDGRVLLAGGLSTGGYLTSAELYAPAAGVFTPTGSLNATRDMHSAALLSDGRVLLAGGYGYSGAFTSTELYDPATGVFTPTTSLNAARYYHTATPLSNGRVLLAGGVGNSGYLASAELYDPASGIFPTGSLNAARYSHTATPLPDGRVLLAGGLGSDFLAIAELYDPVTGAFITTGGLNAVRYAHTATPLFDGRVLLAGGYGYGGYLTSAELYDPTAGVFTLTGSLNVARYDHTATLLPDGRVLVAGGYDGDPLANVELYDPATGAWSNTTGLNLARYAHTATLLPDGRVLLAGGMGKSELFASAELYDPATGTWTVNGWNRLGQMDNAKQWHRAAFDLTPYVGSDVRIRFRFDAGDNYDNDYFGWMVDQVEIRTRSAYTTLEDVPLSVAAPGVLGNDIDPDGDPLSASLGTGPAHGQVSLKVDGAFVYTPSLNYHGPDSFSYIASDGMLTGTAVVSLSVQAVDDPPLAAGDSYTTTEDTPLSVAAPGVLGNDSDPDGNPLAAHLGSGPSHGQLSLKADGAFVYTPSLDYHGPDSFTYIASDGTLTGTALVSLTIQSVNAPPLAAGDSYTTTEDTPLSVAAPGVLGNDIDPDGDPLAASLEAGPSHGQLSLKADGAFVYTPSLHYYGPDSFTYIASDGTLTATALVSLSVQAVNALPLAAGDSYTTTEDTPLSVAAPGVLGNDIDPDGDPLSASLGTGPSHGQLSLKADGAFVYTPSLNYHGPDSFGYIASDGALTATAIVSLRIATANYMIYLPIVLRQAP